MEKILEEIKQEHQRQRDVTTWCGTHSHSNLSQSIGVLIRKAAAKEDDKFREKMIEVCALMVATIEAYDKHFS